MRVWCILFLLMMTVGNVMSQNMKVSGVVVDEYDVPLEGATVHVKNKGWGTTTDKEGRFLLKNVDADEKLIISFLGKETLEVVVRGEGMKVVLHQVITELGEVLVPVAYGNLKRLALTAAVSSIKSETIERRPVTNVLSALEGEVVGVQVNNTYGQPGTTPSIRIRGFNAINGVSGLNEPLYVVDGVPFAGGLSELNPDDVESVSVLKDAAAAALYGNRAANGVVLITLKQATSRKLAIGVTVRSGIYARGMKEYKLVNTDEFMEVMWKSYRNSLMTTNQENYPTMELANAEASSSLISNILGYNIYNMADDQLFDATGHLVEGAVVREDIRKDLDWFAPLERKGFRQQYTLSGGAVNEKGDYYFSLGYLNEEGFLKNAGFDQILCRKRFLTFCLFIYVIFFQIGEID